MFDFMMGRGERPWSGSRGERHWGGGPHGGGRHWGGPPGPWMFKGRHGGRRRRGDVRAAILALLQERPMHGYEMIQELEERSDGMWRPSAGSIYPTLSLLEDEGLIAGEEHEGKRRFALTEAGREAAAERLADRPPPWEQAAEGDSDERREMANAIRQFWPAVVQIMKVGDPDQVQRAKAILDAARKQLYAILAEEE